MDIESMADIIKDQSTRSLVQQFIRLATPKISSIVSLATRSGLDESEVRDSLVNYTISIAERHKYINTLVKANSRFPLYDLFVPQDICVNDEVVSTLNIEGIVEHCPLLIIGSGGTGKSTLMKHILLSTVVERQSLPIFIELRRLNDFKGTVYDLIANDFAKYGIDITSEGVSSSMENDSLLVVYDGFDEVSGALKNSVQEAIEFSCASNNCKVIVTSRSDTGFASWTFVNKARVQDLTEEQRNEFIDKLPVATQSKEKFRRELDGRLRETHASFAKNPLLLSLMALVYMRTGDVPDKDHIFYQRAFYLLFYDHDAAKGPYKREKQAPLAFDDFEKLLSAFSFLLYTKERFEININDAYETVRHASKIMKIKVEPDAYMADLTSGVCILLREGDVVSYLHRSFQEYFTVKFLLMQSDTNCIKLSGHVFRRTATDSPFDLLMQMDRLVASKVASHFAQQAITNIEKICGSEPDPKDVVPYLITGMTPQGNGYALYTSELFENCVPALSMLSTFASHGLADLSVLDEASKRRTLNSIITEYKIDFQSILEVHGVTIETQEMSNRYSAPVGYRLIPSDIQIYEHQDAINRFFQLQHMILQPLSSPRLISTINVLPALKMLAETAQREISYDDDSIDSVVSGLN